MSTLERVSNNAVATQQFDREQLELLKRTVAKGTTDDEFALFTEVCNRTGLNPFARQVYAIKRWDAKEGKEVMGVQTSVDGFRLVADRTGQYVGSEEFWAGPDGEWREVWLDDKPPAAAKVVVYKGHGTKGFSAVATFAEYAQRKKDKGLMPMWAKMPARMLAKCAESLALRKAFPAELSGLYTREEMGQAENASTTPRRAPQRPPEGVDAATGELIEVSAQTIRRAPPAPKSADSAPTNQEKEEPAEVGPTSDGSSGTSGDGEGEGVTAPPSSPRQTPPQRAIQAQMTGVAKALKFDDDEQMRDEVLHAVLRYCTNERVLHLGDLTEQHDVNTVKTWLKHLQLGQAHFYYGSDGQMVIEAGSGKAS